MYCIDVVPIRVIRAIRVWSFPWIRVIRVIRVCSFSWIRAIRVPVSVRAASNDFR